MRGELFEWSAELYEGMLCVVHLDDKGVWDSPLKNMIRRGVLESVTSIEWTDEAVQDAWLESPILPEPFASELSAIKRMLEAATKAQFGKGEPE
jgi:hypothetical protein